MLYRISHTSVTQYVLILTQSRYLLEHVLVEVFLQVAEVLADHLLAQTLARDEELGDCARAEVDEPVLHQVADTFLWLPVCNTTSRTHVKLVEDGKTRERTLV